MGVFKGNNWRFNEIVFGSNGKTGVAMEGRVLQGIETRLTVSAIVLLWLHGCSSPKPAPNVSAAIQSLRTEHYQTAIAQLTPLVEAYPDSVRWFRFRGFASDNLGHYQAGIADFTEVLIRQPGDIASLNNRGYAFYQTNQIGEAVADYNRALELDPGFVSARSNRALALVALKCYPHALLDINRALAEGATTNSTLYNLRGYCLLQLKHPLAAIHAFDRAISLDAGYADAVNNRIAAYQLLARNGKRSL